MCRADARDGLAREFSNLFLTIEIGSINNRAEILARLLKQILLKSNCRLHGEGFNPGAIQPGLKKSHVIETEF